MAFWIILGAAALLGALFLMRRHLVRQAQYDADRLERMRSSAMYARLSALLDQCRNRCVERVVIKPEEVRIVLFMPPQRAYSFKFREQGLDPIDRPVVLEALAQAIAIDVPQLADPNKYYFATHSDVGHGQGRRKWFEYAVQLDYKDQVLRARYDRPDYHDRMLL